MAKISRKELKRDEFASEVSKTYEFVQQQREKLIRFGIAAAAVAVVGLGIYFLFQYRQTRAGDELAHAMRVFYSPPKQEGVPTEPGMSFAEDKARYTQAEKEFAAVANKYSWLRQGRVARYYLGVTRKQLGKTEGALRDLKAVADKQDSQLSGLARFALAELYAETGRLTEAEKLYRELANRPNETISREMALLSLAEQISVKKPSEAEKIYQELKKQGAKGAAGELVEKRLAELKKK